MLFVYPTVYKDFNPQDSMMYLKLISLDSAVG